MPDTPEKPAEGFNYENLASSLDQLREVVRSMVAALTADGFTDREARALVAGLFATNIKGDD